MHRKSLVFVGLVVGAMLTGGLVGAVVLNGQEAAPISGGVPLAAPDGPTVTVTGDVNASLADFTPDANTVEVVTDAGNVTLSSSGDTAAAVHPGTNLTGAWTNVSGITAGGTQLTIQPADKPAISTRGDTDRLSVPDSIGLDDGSADIVIDGTDGGTGTVTFTDGWGLPTNTEVAALDAQSGAVLDVATTDGSGALTLDIPLSEHTVVLQNTDGTVAPTYANPSPTGGLSVPPSQLSVDIADGDFPNDAVDYELRLDGTTLTTGTLTSNGTVTASIPASGQTGGAHTWNVTAVDDYGNKRTTLYEYQVPQNLTFRNETRPSEIITQPTNVTIYPAGETEPIIERQVSDGNLSLEGAPVNQNLIVEVVVQDGSDGYVATTAYLDTLYEQQDIYILNQSATPTVEDRFVLNDPTGEYGSDSVLFIQRPINRSGTTTYETVFADRFGAEGVTTLLDDGQRYRLKVATPDGDSQIVGPYRADVSETVTVVPSTPEIDLGNETAAYDAGATLNNRTLTWEYSDPAGETDRLRVIIHEKGDESNRLQPPAEFFTLGNTSQVITLTENESETTWVVDFEVDRDGESLLLTREVNGQKDLAGQLGSNWQAIGGIGLLFLLGAAFSQLNVAVGAVVVAVFGGILWFVGLLGGVATGAGVVFALLISIVNHLRTTGGP
jgi:hypothetical protein